MPTNFSSTDYRRNQEATIKACDEVAIVKNASLADDYNAFVAKVIAKAAMTSADVAIVEVTVDSNGSGTGDKVTINGKSAPRTGVALKANDDLAVAYYNTVAKKVHLVLDASDIDIGANNATVLIPPTTHYLRHPTAKA